MNLPESNIEVFFKEAGEEVWMKLHIRNTAGNKIIILNPDMGIPSPGMNWPYSKEVYQTFLLLSYGFMSISLINESGQDIPRLDIPIAITPALRPPIELEPNDSFSITIPISNFYQLKSGERYHVAIVYGDQNLKISAQTDFIA